MKEPRLRFTTQEKVLILRETDLVGLEAVLVKHKLNVKTLVHWQKKFKGTKTGNSICFVKTKCGEKKDPKPRSKGKLMNEKEDELLRLVASLIAQSLLEKDKPDR
ncbi:MAG TPA: hypothetical protein VGQ53_19230 [Chitinophagaceae bacterium]|jgi:hypothetical protein|nr:hypothetical protein [Chitinophagaceae bacterium]